MQHALNQCVSRIGMVVHPDAAWMERDANKPRLSPRLTVNQIFLNASSTNNE